MKTKKTLLGLLCLFIGVLMLFSSCKKEEDPVITEDPVTKIVGTAKLQAGTSGSLSNALVSIYLSVDDWNSYNSVATADVNGSGAKITYVFNEVVPGNYYLDLWLDADNSGDWSIGDFVGWIGSGQKNAPSLSPFMVAEGKTVTKNIDVVVI
jgi:hypothetical protein